MSTTTGYLGGTVTLTDDGELLCSREDIRTAVAGKLSAFGDVQTTFDYLRAWRDLPTPPLQSTRRTPSGAARAVPGDVDEVRQFLDRQREALVRRYPQVRLVETATQ